MEKEAVSAAHIESNDRLGSTLPPAAVFARTSVSSPPAELADGVWMGGTPMHRPLAAGLRLPGHQPGRLARF
jgi:hypothetical protein